jgi:flagellar biosynthesis protein FlhF
MNVKRFTARTSRDALSLVRQSFGADAVVLSTRPCAEGVEVLAMAPESVQQFERVTTPAATRGAAAAAPNAVPRSEPARADTSLERTTVAQDAERLAMSTLSFQDYVRERMLRRRKAELQPTPAAATSMPEPAQPAPQAAAPAPQQVQQPAPRITPPPVRAIAPMLQDDFEPPVTMSRMPPAIPVPVLSAEPARRDQAEMMNELRAMKGLIEQRFGALAFMEKLQRQPRQAQLTQKLLDCGFSPALIRKMADSLPNDIDENVWAASVLERNLATGEHDSALEDAGGVYALIGSTGVGKTTSTAKLAAAFATRHGAANLGLITLDAYRVAAHEQLRAYGRILGVPVHTAHDRASLEDLLDLLAGKKMVLIDTAGMPQRDARTRELLDMLSGRNVQRLLVVNAAAQGETIEDVLQSYRATSCCGVVLSKIDEAVKIGPALDALIRHKLKVIAVANGQRVPEDWHRLSAGTLVQRALRGGGSPAWKLDASDVSLVFAGTTAPPQAAAVVR